MPKSDFDEYFALREKGEFRQAYDILREILETNPRWSKVGDLYVWCADFELTLNDDVHQARKLLEKARKLGCRFMAPYLRLHGYVSWRLGEREKGTQELKRCVELDPSITHLKSLGKLLTAEGTPDALSVWERVLEKDPLDCCAHIYLGREAVRSSDRGRALLLLKRAERLNPSIQDVDEMAMLYYDLAEFRSAIRTYTEADRRGKEPKGPLYAAVAACHFSLGENTVGEKYLRWAMRHNPEHEFVKQIYENHRELFNDEVS